MPSHKPKLRRFHFKQKPPSCPSTPVHVKLEQDKIHDATNACSDIAANLTPPSPDLPNDPLAPSGVETHRAAGSQTFLPWLSASVLVLICSCSGFRTSYHMFEIVSAGFCKAAWRHTDPPVRAIGFRAKPQIPPVSCNLVLAEARLDSESDT